MKRGCLSDLPEYEMQMCRNEGAFCKTCQNDNCNQKVAFQTCYSCNSDSEADCVSNPSAALQPNTCRQYTDTCITVVTTDGQTQRGCSSEIQAIVTSDEICDSNNCNSGVYPADRKRCHQCSGNECNQLLQDNDASLQLCNNYDSNDRCFAYLNGAFSTKPRIFFKIIS